MLPVRQKFAAVKNFSKQGKEERQVGGTNRFLKIAVLTFAFTIKGNQAKTLIRSVRS